MKLHPTNITGFDEYCSAVQAGAIEVCKEVQLAVRRHYRDMDRAANDPEFPFYFERKAAVHFFDFCASLNQYEGEFAGKPIILEPCQQFWFGSLFGWLHKETKLRRFREAYIELPKKNGKSLIGAAIALYGLVSDDEPGAQIYNLATNRMQAMKLSYRAAERMILNTPWLKERLTINKGMATMGIKYEQTDSFFEPLTSKPSSLDGFNVHMFIGDEIKDWEDSTVWNLLDDGTITRRQPLSIGITTAGHNRASLGYELRDYAVKVLKGALDDERFWGIIYGMDLASDDETGSVSKDEKEWDTERVWKKCNPLYGVTIKADYFEKKIVKARENPIDKTDFLVKHLNRWTHSYNKWMNIDQWMKCADPELSIEIFAGQPCYIFYDLASKQDITSLAVMFRHGTTEAGKPRYFVDVINFLPSVVVEEKIVGRRSSYNGWADNGLLRLTPGNTTDYDYIEEETQELGNKAAIMRAGFDPWNASHLSNNIQKRGIKTTMIKQNALMLSEPMKTLQAWVLDDQIVHNGNPVLLWSMENITAREDKKGNIFPVKEHPDSKIDPAVAIINLVAMELDTPLPVKRKRKIWGAVKI